MWIIYKFVIYGIISLLSTNNNFSSARRLQCPQICICDEYMNMQRANCSGQRIINCHMDIPKYTEILDLSYNDITILDDTCFHELRHLKVLSLDHNSINTIYLNAFSHLKKLEHLIISNNRLELFDRMIVEQNHKLIILNISGNKFINLQDTPLLKSRSLESLDLHGSQINHIHASMFEGLSHIKSIDLSNNYLITLNIQPFLKHKHKLRYLNLDMNKWNCDQNMEVTLKWLKQHLINVTLNGCSIKTSTHNMFERMEMLPSTSDDKIMADIEIKNTSQEQFTKSNIASDADLLSKTQTTVTEETLKSNNFNNNNKAATEWRISTINSVFNQICPITVSDKACDLLESCLLKYSFQQRNDRHDKKNHNHNQNHNNLNYNNNQHRSPSSQTVALIFGFGFILGIVLGGSIVYCMNTLMADCRIKKRRGRRNVTQIHGINELRSGRHQNEYVTMPVNNNNNNNNNRDYAPTVPPRRTSMHPPNTTAVQSDTIAFFSSLFQRPARHRYYQTINQNATNLVRRLSQSRLFLNSSRAQAAAARQASNTSSSNSNNHNNSSNNNNIETSTTTNEMRVTTTTTSTTNTSSTITSSSATDITSPLLHHNDRIRLIDSSSDIQSTPYLTQSMPSLATIGYESVSTNEIDFIVDRGESPPPAYIDIVNYKS